MRHTALTVRNFGAFALTSATLGTLSTLFGAVDLIMVARFGSVHVAAVGMGELIVAAVFAVLFGYSDLFGTRLARNEHADAAANALHVLFGVYSLTITTVSAVFVAAALLVTPLMAAAYPELSLAWPISAYVIIRFATVGLFMIYVTTIEALKIRGMKGFAFLPVVIGLGLNVLGNALFLYTPMAGLFWNVEAAVATSTAVAQLATAVLALLVYFRRFPLGRIADSGLDWRRVKAQYPRFVVSGFRIGTRNLNDYICNAVPLLFIATMGAEVTAAATVATKIATIFYRVPQSCFGASLVFYSYALGRDRHRQGVSREHIRRLIVYSAVPTAVAALVFILFRHELALVFGGAIRVEWVVLLLLAYFAFLPAYFLEHFFGELLVAHQRDMILFTLSACATIMIVIPFSYYAAMVQQSAFLAIAGRGLAAIPLGLGYWFSLRPYLQPVGAT